MAHWRSVESPSRHLDATGFELRVRSGLRKLSVFLVLAEGRLRLFVHRQESWFTWERPFWPSLSPKDLAKFAMWGGVGPLAVNDSIAKGQALVAKDAEIAALKAQLAKLSGVQPLAGGQAPSAAPTNNDDTKPAGMSFGEWTALQASRAGVLQR